MATSGWTSGVGSASVGWLVVLVASEAFDEDGRPLLLVFPIPMFVFCRLFEILLAAF
jgi:hypothetical protein